MKRRQSNTVSGTEQVLRESSAPTPLHYCLGLTHEARSAWMGDCPGAADGKVDRGTRAVLKGCDL